MTTTTPPIDSTPLAADPIARRLPFFYGWIMLPVATITLIATSPGQTFLVAMFYPYFAESLQLSATQITTAYMIGTALAALPITFIGALMDKFGIRIVMTFVVILFGATCILTSFVSNLITLFLAFLFLRMLGQSALTLIAENTVAMWFHKHLGKATAIKSIGMAAGLATLPWLVQTSIESRGWQQTYIYLGLAIWITLIPIVAVIYRNKPRDVGQRTDGLAHPTPDNNSPANLAPKTDHQFTLQQALQTRSFWILCLINATFSLIATAVIFHIKPLLESKSIDPSFAATWFVTFSLTAVAMQLVSGYLADKFQPRFLLSIALTILTAALFLLYFLHNITTAHLYAATFAAGQSLYMVTANTLWPRYFGRKHLGKIRGASWIAMVTGSSVGPFIVGFIHDQHQSYNMSIVLFIAMFTPLIFIAPFATKPKQPAIPS